MLDHVSIAVTDLDRAARFYDAVLAALGHASVWRDGSGIGYGPRNGPDDDGRCYLTIRPVGRPLAACDGRHWAFRAPSRAAVRTFHAAALGAGGTDDGAPGLRPIYHVAYYAAFVRDPDGNRLEAVCHRREV